MNFRIALEWDEECGLSLSKMYPFREGVEEKMSNKDYGKGIQYVSIVLVCRPHDFKQRKRFKKDVRRLEYDILIDYFQIKHVLLDDKKNIIRRQVYEITEQVFAKYKFEDFDKDAFLSDLKAIVKLVEW